MIPNKIKDGLARLYLTFAYYSGLLSIGVGLEPLYCMYGLKDNQSRRVTSKSGLESRFN